MALSSATERQRALETCIDLGHRAVRQDANALFQGTTVDRGCLGDVDDRVGFETGRIRQPDVSVKQREELNARASQTLSSSAARLADV